MAWKAGGAKRRNTLHSPQRKLSKRHS